MSLTKTKLGIFLLIKLGLRINYNLVVRLRLVFRYVFLCVWERQGRGSDQSVSLTYRVKKKKHQVSFATVVNIKKVLVSFTVISKYKTLCFQLHLNKNNPVASVKMNTGRHACMTLNSWCLSWAREAAGLGETVYSSLRRRETVTQAFPLTAAVM